MSRRVLLYTVVLFGIFIYASSPVVNFIQRNKTVAQKQCIVLPCLCFFSIFCLEMMQLFAEL